MKSAARLIEPFDAEHDEAEFDPWCKVPTTENSWPITDDHSDNVVAILDFEFPLASGKCLTEVPQLLAAAKATTRLLRNQQEREMSGTQHALHHRDILTVIHAFSTRRISSLAEVQYQDTIEVISRMRHGIDSILQASLRINAYLALKQDVKEFAEPCVKRTARGVTILNRKEIIRRCHLPESVATLPGVARAFAKAEKRLGFRRQNKHYSSNEKPSVTQATISTLR